MLQITRNNKACYGCRTCELACSFHNLGVFTPGGGAIKVRKDNRTGKIKWVKAATCDLCKEDQPLCVRHCPYGALSVSNGEEIN